MTIDHIPEMISLAQHQRVLAGGEKMRKGSESAACLYGTPGDLAIFVHEAMILLDIAPETDEHGNSAISRAIGRLERYTGREL